MVKIGDYVVATCDFGNIKRRAVGIVRRINGDYDVYFIGVDATVNCKPEQVVQFDIDKTGKPKKGPLYPLKICNKCHLLKDHFKEFEFNQHDGQGRNTVRPSCHDCRVDIEGKKVLPSEKRRMDKIKPKPKSIFICPLCNRRTIVGVTVRITLDHSARSGRARDWICDSCNTGLGRFKDDILFLERLVTYLKRYG